MIYSQFSNYILAGDWFIYAEIIQAALPQTSGPLDLGSLLWVGLVCVYSEDKGEGAAATWGPDLFWTMAEVQESMCGSIFQASDLIYVGHIH